MSINLYNEINTMRRAGFSVDDIALMLGQRADRVRDAIRRLKANEKKTRQRIIAERNNRTVRWQ